MKLGALFSGGKDSTYALFKAMKEHKVVCLISLRSLNPESYMFHIPAFEIISQQAEALGIPLILVETKGEKEKELVDLKKAIEKAVSEFGIQGIVTGAVASEYQRSRIAKICDELNLKCVNPLWGMDQIELLKEMVENKFKIIVVGVAAYPLEEEWLGREIDLKTIEELEGLQKKYKINPAGEGGEFETMVLDSPIHKKKIKLLKVRKEFSEGSGVLKIIEIKSVKK
ncbi:TIGR00289 family protein [Candidatus Woesearchaeota archaeon]|nr:TIGR00289 family protein [Candidatus Woesearchaeota archaeon]